MSRSFKKIAIHGVCSGSDKQDKTLANRKFRRIVKELLKKNIKNLPTKLKEVSNVWSFQKDGKSGVFYTKKFLSDPINSKIFQIYKKILRK